MRYEEEAPSERGAGSAMGGEIRSTGDENKEAVGQDIHVHRGKRKRERELEG